MDAARAGTYQEAPGAWRHPGVARAGGGGTRCPLSWQIWVPGSLTAETRAADLEVALATGRRIGIAVGILMCRLGVTEDRAFAVLSKHSQDH